MSTTHGSGLSSKQTACLLGQDGKDAVVAARLRFPRPVQRWHPKPSDWGVGMTLCIAAFVNMDEGIMALADNKFDLGSTSGEGAGKIRAVNRGWVAMFAGDDTTQAPRIHARVVDVLTGVDADQPLVEKAFINAYHETLVEKIENAVLSPYGLRLSEFIQSGYKQFGPDSFAQIRQEIAAVEIGCECLVFGFDSLKKPHIFTIGKRGLPESYNHLGFWAIGSGADAAVNSLFFHDYSRAMPVYEVAYHVCAAKFIAERAELSKVTHAFILRPDGYVTGVNDVVVRELWEREGKPRTPTDLEGSVKEYLHDR